MSAVGENYRRLLERIGEAAGRSGRPPEAIRLLGVTKTVPIDRIREAVECGLRDLGENRVQEAEKKMPALGGIGIRWHLIGHLQSNKASRAAALFSAVQSLDSIKLAERLDRAAGGRLAVWIQVRLGEEATKSGVGDRDLGALVEAARRSKHLDLRGLMGIPPFFEDPESVRPYFRRLRQRAEEFALPEISMGMSHDFEVAIEEGATMVRIGTALFGERK